MSRDVPLMDCGSPLTYRNGTNLLRRRLGHHRRDRRMVSHFDDGVCVRYAMDGQHAPPQATRTERHRSATPQALIPTHGATANACQLCDAFTRLVRALVLSPFRPAGRNGRISFTQSFPLPFLRLRAFVVVCGQSKRDGGFLLSTCRSNAAFGTAATRNAVLR